MIEGGIVAVCVVNKIVDVPVELEENFGVVSDSTEASNFALEEVIIDGGVTCKGGPAMVRRHRRILCDSRVCELRGVRFLQVGEGCSILPNFHDELVGGKGGRKTLH